MEHETIQTTSAPTMVTSEKNPHAWNTVTPFSKYMAMVLFVLLPFIGGWAGYQYGQNSYVKQTEEDDGHMPEEPLVRKPAEESGRTPAQSSEIVDGAYLDGRYWKVYSLPWTDLTVAHPAGWLVDEEGTWSGVAYAFLDYAWPAELPIEEYLDYSHEMYSGSLYDVLDVYYSDPAHAALREAFDERHDEDRENGIAGITIYYVYKPSDKKIDSLSVFNDILSIFGDDLSIVAHGTKPLGDRVWRVGTMNGDVHVLMSEFEEVFVLLLTDMGDPERQAVMEMMAEHIGGKGILADDHPGCCY